VAQLSTLGIVTSVKTTFTVLAAILLLAACAHHPGSDAALHTKIVGTWSTADVILPDQARVSDIVSTFRPDGSWIDRYTVTRAGDSRKQTTAGTWQIEGGFMFEVQTNVDGVAVDTTAQRAGSKILKLDSHEMILSNWYAPKRIFLRKE
jgi:hypothetical protein